jgi:thioredoxin reductase (NADPH)
MEMEHELIVIGAGPAGLSASIYAGRARLKTLLLEKETLGGYLLNIESIENYPGFPDGISGVELGSNMIAQATKYGVQFAFGEVEEIDFQGNSILVKTGEIVYRSKTCIVATGCQPKRLNVPGEDAFAERGVIYCAVCDGAQFEGKAVAVVGGGDSGITEALYLRRLHCRVIIIEAEQQINANQYLQEKVFADPNIDILCHTKVETIIGDEWVNGINLLDLSNNKKTMLKVDGVLVHAGRQPNTGFLKDRNLLDAEGAIKIGSPKLETPVNKIYTAGDVRQGSPRQVATAVGDGVTAALSAYTSCLLTP